MEERTFELGLNTDNIWTNEPLSRGLEPGNFRLCMERGKYFDMTDSKVHYEEEEKQGKSKGT